MSECVLIKQGEKANLLTKAKNVLKNKQHLFFIIGLFLAVVFLIIKAPLGWIFFDEPFMLTLGHRLLKGDNLLINEWNIGQMISLFNLPLIWLYTTITNSTEGIIMFFRYYFILWWVFCSVILYLRTKKYGWVSIIAVLYFLLFAPLRQMGINYNSMGLSFMLLFCTYFLTGGSKVKDYINGAVLACAVLSYPYLISVYFLYALAVFIVNLTKLKEKQFFQIPLFDLKKFLRISLVAIILAIIVVAVIFSAGIGKVFDAIIKILGTISVAKSESLLLKIIKLPGRLFLGFKEQWILFFVGVTLFFIDKKREKHSLIYFAIQVVGFVYSMLFFVTHVMPWGYTNYDMFPIVILGFSAFIFSKERDWELFLSLFVIGVIYGTCSHFSSDTGVKAVANGCTVSGFAGIIFIYQYINQLKNNEIIEKLNLKIILPIALAVVFSLQLGIQGILRMASTDEGLTTKYFAAKVQDGVAKGVITTQVNADYYSLVLQDAEEIQKITKKDSKFLSVSLYPAIYLDIDECYAGYSTWTYISNSKDFEGLNQRLIEYYKFNPDKIPDAIYVTKVDFEYFLNMTFVDINAYTQIELNAGYVYIKK